MLPSKAWQQEQVDEHEAHVRERGGILMADATVVREIKSAGRAFAKSSKIGGRPRLLRWWLTMPKEGDGLNGWGLFASTDRAGMPHRFRANVRLG